MADVRAGESHSIFRIRAAMRRAPLELHPRAALDSNQKYPAEPVTRIDLVARELRALRQSARSD